MESTESLTSESEAFERVIRENPLEVTPYLVYADWLDEYGVDPVKAEYLRLLIRLSGKRPRKVTYDRVNLVSAGPGYYWDGAAWSQGGAMWTDIYPGAVQAGDRMDLMCSVVNDIYGLRRKKYRPRYGMLVTKIDEIDEDASVCRVVWKEDEESVPDPLAADWDRLDEILKGRVELIHYGVTRACCALNAEPSQ